jgi:hypothetical protein
MERKRDPARSRIPSSRVLTGSAESAQSSLLRGWGRVPSGYECRVEVAALPVAVGNDAPSNRDSSCKLVIECKRIVDDHLAGGLLNRDQVSLYNNDGTGDAFVAVCGVWAATIWDPRVVLPGSTVSVDIRRRLLSICDRSRGDDARHCRQNHKYSFHVSHDAQCRQS